MNEPTTMNLKLWYIYVLITNMVLAEEEADRAKKNLWQNKFAIKEEHRICHGGFGLNRWPMIFINGFGYANLYNAYCVDRSTDEQLQAAGVAGISEIFDSMAGDKLGKGVDKEKTHTYSTSYGQVRGSWSTYGSDSKDTYECSGIAGATDC